MPAEVYRFEQCRFRFPPRVYLDTNFVLAWYLKGHRDFGAASKLLTELTVQKVTIALSTLVVDEAWWRLIIAYYERDNGQGAWTDDVLKNDSGIPKRYYPELEKFTVALLRYPRSVVLDAPIAASELVQKSKAHIQRFSLAPRDAFHVSMAQACGIDMIITNDKQFEAVDGLRIMKY